MPEQDFWKTMTPRRLLATLRPPERELQQPERRQAVSLSAYLGGA